ncbi:hypothetical protein [Streptomyces mirabilis]|uniref:hypothetical protein n=1 Tax=Streptomyces mirabilis TaxID=68239 RepID=UPI0033B14F6B
MGCLRQGLAIARDYNLDLDWLTDAAWTYVGDSVWEPVTPPAPGAPAPGTPAGALVELLSTLTRRQYEHRARIVSRLTAVLDADLLPADQQEMVLYYRAKAPRDTGRAAQSRRDYQQVADQGGRLAPQPAAAWPTPHAWPATSPPPSPPLRISAGRAATNACWVTCTGFKASPSVPPRPTSPDAPKPNSTARPARAAIRWARCPITAARGPCPERFTKGAARNREFRSAR